MAAALALAPLFSDNCCNHAIAFAHSRPRTREPANREPATLR